MIESRSTPRRLELVERRLEQPRRHVAVEARDDDADGAPRAASLALEHGEAGRHREVAGSMLGALGHVIRERSVDTVLAGRLDELVRCGLVDSAAVSSGTGPELAPHATLGIDGDRCLGAVRGLTRGVARVGVSELVGGVVAAGCRVGAGPVAEHVLAGLVERVGVVEARRRRAAEVRQLLVVPSRRVVAIAHASAPFQCSGSNLSP